MKSSRRQFLYSIVYCIVILVFVYIVRHVAQLVHNWHLIAAIDTAAGSGDCEQQLVYAETLASYYRDTRSLQALASAHECVALQSSQDEVIALRHLDLAVAANPYDPWPYAVYGKYLASRSMYSQAYGMMQRSRYWAFEAGMNSSWGEYSEEYLSLAENLAATDSNAAVRCYVWWHCATVAKRSELNTEELAAAVQQFLVDHRCADRIDASQIRQRIVEELR